MNDNLNMMTKLIHDVRHLEEALVTRGFAVRALHNRLIPTLGAAWHEWGDLKTVLAHAGVVYQETGHSLAILEVEHLEDVVLSIRFYKSARPMTEPLWYDSNWKSFTRRRFSRKSSALEHAPGLAYLVKSMGRAGIMTEYSNDGRGTSRPYIEFAGPWNGIWFEYLLANHMPMNDLHYAWSIKPHKYGKVRLSPCLPAEGQRWDLAKLQADSVRMGQWLDRYAADIHAMKRECFKYRSMKQEADARAEDYETLKRWMTEKIGAAITV